MTFSAHRNVAAFEYPIGATNTDCATKAGLCELVVQGTQSQDPVTAGLTFNPTVKAVLPGITAAPATGLHDNQAVSVLLHGFIPNESVIVVECAADAISESNLSYCDYTTAQTTSPSGFGTGATTARVHRAIGGQAGLVDCAARPGECVLVAFENGNNYYGYYGGSAVGPAGPANAQRSTGKSVPLKAAPGSSLPNIASTPLTFSTN